MPQPPILKTMDDLLEKLKDSTRIYREAEKASNEYANALRALANVCEDEETKMNYLLAVEEITEKPGFVEAVRSALRSTRNALTTTEIKGTILLLKKMDFSGYSNPMASIHTTLRRMKDRGEVQEGVNTQGDKVYRLVLKEQVASWQRGTLAKIMAEDERKKLFPTRLGQPDPLNRHGKK